MKISEIISILQTAKDQHGDTDFYIEAIETDDGSVIIGNDFVGIEVHDFEGRKGIVLKVETLAMAPKL